MSLKSIPPDPKPTKVQIKKELARLRPWFSTTQKDRKILRDLASLCWMSDEKMKNPDAFLFPFVRNPDEYNKYRKTEVWKKIRARVLEEANYECAGCFNKATQVHHRDYRPRVLSGEDITPLVALCAECHKKVDKENGRAREIWQDKERVLEELVTQKRKQKRISQ